MGASFYSAWVFGRQAVSSGFSFASTYALGHIAKRYYAGGRALSGPALKEASPSMLGEAKGLVVPIRARSEAKARTSYVGKVLAEVGK